jgi:DNA-binding GntR family transcriptional regulator
MNNIDIDQINENINELMEDKNEFSNKIGEDYKNLGEQVYNELKKMIIFHEIEPGERIIDKHLADDMGVSRSLVRQAFTILEKEELIKSVPRSGFYVKEISVKDIEEIYDIRKVLEKAATELAVTEIPEEEIEEVNEIFELAKEDLDKDHVRMFVKADTELHRMIVNNCGNTRLIKLINNYNDRFVYYRIVDLSRVKRAKNAYFEHLEIFEAVKNREVEKAVELMGKHIEHAKEIIISNFKEYNDL